MALDAALSCCPSFFPGGSRAHAVYERTMTANNVHGHSIVISRQHANKRAAKRLGWEPGTTQVWYDPSGNRYIIRDGWRPGNARQFADMPSRLVR